MTGSSTPSGFDTTLTSRYECKYLIDERTARALRRFLALHTELDPYSARSEGQRYRVMSLYLDSPDLQLYQDTAQGIRNRYKLRLRYYAERGEGPVFLEVKKRADVIVRKSRQLVSRAQASEFLDTGCCPPHEGCGPDFYEFLERCRESCALPALRLRYWREAWESRGVDPVRITFDTEVQHCVLSDRGLCEEQPQWVSTDLDAPVILEVKFTDLRPHWLNQMLQRFELDKVSVAKYAESIEHLQRHGGRGRLEASLSRVLPQWRGGSVA